MLDHVEYTSQNCLHTCTAHKNALEVPLMPLTSHHSCHSKRDLLKGLRTIVTSYSGQICQSASDVRLIYIPSPLSATRLLVQG